MSWQSCPDAAPGDMQVADSIETVIVPRARDLGGFEVRRALPSRMRQMVGPFIFFDQMGPAEFSVGQGIDVRPHPHINLATVTYLFDGEIIHRDSLGTMMPIRPGAVNWMTAGRGIVHSERTSPELKARGSRLFGLQTWVALPAAHEETDPSFAHYEETDLPVLEAEGKRVRVVVGQAWGLRSPVETFSDTIYADITLEPGAALPLDAAHEERAVYVVSGVVNIGVIGPLLASFWCCAQVRSPSAMSRMSPRGSCWSAARQWTGLATFGGTSSPRGPNGSSRQKQTGRLAASVRVPGDAEEFIPLPDTDKVASYP